jgi:flagellar hook-length control protein FliK
LPSVLDLNQPKLADNMGQQIQWMMGKNISRATLELNPAQLGPLKITIDMQQNQTNIQVLAAHHLTRDMLEQSLPRLREFLQDAGLTNVQFSIGQDSAQGQGASQGQTANSGGQSSSGAAPGGVGPVGAGHEPASAGATTLSTTTWRLDTFA